MSNNHTILHIEQALRNTREAPIPQTDLLSRILSQLPEQKKYKEDTRNVRSPYIFVALTQVVALGMLLIAIYIPGTEHGQPTLSDPERELYSIDRDIDAFEAAIDAEDARYLADEV